MHPSEKELCKARESAPTIFGRDSKMAEQWECILKHHSGTERWIPMCPDGSSGPGGAAGRLTGNRASHVMGERYRLAFLCCVLS